MSSLEVSHRSTVTPDQIDDLGHMNVRYYGVNAAAGTRAVCERLGLGRLAMRSGYTRHHHEQMEGNELVVRSAVVPGGERLRIYHELRNVADDDLAATFVHELDHPPVDAPDFELPAYGAPRSLSLTTDALTSAPDLARLQQLGLAMREPRQVDSDDTVGADTVPPGNSPNLLWGGEPFEEYDWVRTLLNGDRFAYAVMEQRMWIRPGPVAIGTSIQSFRATLEIGDRPRRPLVLRPRHGRTARRLRSDRSLLQPDRTAIDGHPRRVTLRERPRLPSRTRTPLRSLSRCCRVRRVPRVRACRARGWGRLGVRRAPSTRSRRRAGRTGDLPTRSTAAGSRLRSGCCRTRAR
ncbi:MAG: thioesterase family protein [Actinomycetota bacterium]